MENLEITESELAKFEITQGFDRALDNNFQRIRETARKEWERRFAGNDPSDACVSVRISAAETIPAQTHTVPTAGFLKDGKRQHKPKIAVRQFAH